MSKCTCRVYRNSSTSGMHKIDRCDWCEQNEEIADTARKIAGGDSMSITDLKKIEKKFWKQVRASMPATEAELTSAYDRIVQTGDTFADRLAEAFINDCNEVLEKPNA